jgi:hypothetical protein
MPPEKRILGMWPKSARRNIPHSEKIDSDLATRITSRLSRSTESRFNRGLLPSAAQAPTIAQYHGLLLAFLRSALTMLVK